MKRAKGIVACGHEKTAEAAKEILESGGNAYDAILGAFFASTVAEPVLSSLGGGGFLLARTAEGKAMLYDFFVNTPSTKKPLTEIDFFPVVADFGTVTQEFHVGMGSIAVPGSVAGVFKVHEELGSLPMKHIVEPAVRYAKNGVKVDRLQESIFDIIGEIYKVRRECFDIYRSKHEPDELVREGEFTKNPELGETFEMLAHEGSEVFYHGEIARIIAGDSADGGGYITQEDLTKYKVAKRHPLSVKYRDAEFITNPPPSSGGILIAFALKLLEKHDLSSLSPEGAEYLDLLAHTMELANKARKDGLDKNIYDRMIVAEFLEPHILARYQKLLSRRVNRLGSTTHMSVIDAEGNAASMTVTNGEGSAYVVPGTGIVLNNILGEEDLNPNGFHNWKEGQRISSMMAPSIVHMKDGRTIAVGSGGSNRIRSAILQTVLNLVDFGLPVQRAANNSRIHYENGTLNVEHGFPKKEVSTLKKDFKDLNEWEGKSLFFGGAHTVLHDTKSDAFDGAGDERRGGVARQAFSL